MSYNDTDGTIVECLVCLRVKEGILQDTCREADFVSRRIIIGIDSLWCHVPLVTINRFSCFLLDVPIVAPSTACLDILVVTLRRIYSEFGIVLPLVRIAYLYVKSTQFLVSVGFGRIAHPRLCIDALVKRRLQVLHEFLHDFFRRCGEVSVAIHLSQGLAHGALYLIGCTLPQWEIFFSARHGFAKEIKIGFTNLVCEIT